MRAGSLRHSLVIQSKTESADQSGGTAETWATHQSLWRGRVNPWKATEIIEARQNVPRITHEITVRYLSTLTHNMRIYWDSRYFYIAGIRNPDERNIMQVLECYEDAT